MELNLDTAKKFTDIVISRLEGGYYHPKMKEYLVNGDKMGNSGETMYGLDFAAGGDAISNSQFAQEVSNYFAPYVAQIHDNSSAFSIYNDKADGNKVAPAELGQRWRPMAAQIMLDRFKSYFAKLTPGAQQIVLTDPALFMQFWYGAWNGPVAFNKFAEVMNRAYSNGERDPWKLCGILQDARYERGTGRPALVDQITAEMNGRANYTELNNTPATTNNRRVWPLVLFGALATILIVKSLK